VLALVDDWGWANFGPHRTNETGAELEGSQETHTPTLDQLVKDGVLLDRHYAYKICSPSRSSLQSGRLAVHVNTENKAVSTYNASDPVRTASTQRPSLGGSVRTLGAVVIRGPAQTRVILARMCK
jgi:arylsulfatase I/J